MHLIISVVGMLCMSENCTLSKNMETQEKSGELQKIVESGRLCVCVCLYVLSVYPKERWAGNLGNLEPILAPVVGFKEPLSFNDPDLNLMIALGNYSLSIIVLFK